MNGVSALGPICKTRDFFQDMEHKAELIQKDLDPEFLTRSLVTSPFRF